MKLNSKYIDKRKYNLLFIITVIFGFVITRNFLDRLAASASDFTSPLPETPPIVIEKQVAVKVEVIKIPTEPTEIIRTVFKDNPEEAIKVAECESGLNPKAKNGSSTATGLFQIMSSLHGVNRTNLQDPLINTLMAKKLYDSSGWWPWLASNGCHGLLN